MFYVKKNKLILTQEQVSILDSQSKICNWLYNHYLAVSIRYYGLYHKTLRYMRINSTFSKFKNRKQFLKTVNNTVLKNTLRTLEKSYNNFFRRVRQKKDKLGFPKFHSWKKKWMQLEYDKNVGFKIKDNGNVLIVSLGAIVNREGKKYNPKLEIRLAERIKDKPEQLTIVRKGGIYYACFRLEKEEPKIREIGDTISLDLNQSNLFASIDTKGNAVKCDKPTMAKYFDKQIDKVKSKRDLCKKYSRRWKYLNNTISRLYDKRREQIKLCLYTIANRVIEDKRMVLVGDYAPFKTGIKNINHGTIAQGLVGQFRSTLSWVCKKNGVVFQEVNERFTSKTCSKCGRVKTKDGLKLTDRTYICECGYIEDRDVNSAINIMNKILPRIGESSVRTSTAMWTWMSNCLNTVTVQTKLNIEKCII